MTSWKPRGKATQLGGVWYRSKWEAYIARLLFLSKIEFQYEPARFYLDKDLSYLPDFYLTKEKIYIEVKGNWSKQDVLKTNMFAMGEHIKLLILDKEQVEYILGKPSSYISAIKNMATYSPTAEELSRLRTVIRTAKDNC